MMNASPAPQEIFLLKLGEVVLKGQNRQSFEDKLKQFMSVSDSKQSELNRYMSGKRGGGRRRK
mgnify:CR=1 FL=1